MASADRFLNRCPPAAGPEPPAAAQAATRDALFSLLLRATTRRASALAAGSPAGEREAVAMELLSFVRRFMRSPAFSEAQQARLAAAEAATHR